MKCEVASNCKVARRNCPYCANGSEYRPVDKKVLFPAEAERVAVRQQQKREQKNSEACRIGKHAKRKGSRREREVAKLLGGERVPLSGMLDGHPNDVILPNGWRTEVKARKTGLGVLYGWIEAADIVAFREQDGEWLFAMDLPHFKLWLDGEGVRRQSLSAALASIRRGETDLVVTKGLRLAARERKSGFSTIRAWLDAEKADALLFKADRMEWLAIMDEEHLLEMLTAPPRISGGET